MSDKKKKKKKKKKKSPKNNLNNEEFSTLLDLHSVYLVCQALFVIYHPIPILSYQDITDSSIDNRVFTKFLDKVL